MLIAVGLGDFLVGGKLTAVSKDALMATIRALKPVAVSEAKGLTRLAARGVTRGIPMAARAARFAARTNPYTLAALLMYEGYIHRDAIMDVAETIAEADIPSIDIPLVERSAVTAGKVRVMRKVSKANKAVKQGMKELKAGTKASTGADKGKLPKGAFGIATKAAGLANPKTKSKIGKGKTVTNKLARRLKKWW